MSSSVPTMRFSPPRVLVTLVICALLVGAAQRVLGLPDLALVRAFAAGGRPSGEAAMATASLLVWTALGTVCSWLVLVSCQGLPREVGRLRRPRVRGGAVVMVIGVCLLASGLARHAGAAPQVCCGSIEEAAQNLGR